MNFDEKQQNKVELRCSPESDDPCRSVPSATVGNFVLAEQLSIGSASTLHKGVHHANGAVAAIKIIKPPAGLEAGFKKRLKVEVDSVARLCHPSILSILESGKSESIVYVATEYVDDPTLFDVVHASANISKATILGYLVSACEALAHAHSNGVVHRKLSSDKIFISDDATIGEHVRVSGFGTGWLGDSQKADPRTDVLAFGRLMEEAFTGSPMTPELESMIAFCTAPHPTDRYADCQEVLENLLLLSRGRAPEPPKSRPLQGLTKPVPIAILISIVVMGLVALGSALALSARPPAALIAKPAVQAAQAEIKKEIEKAKLQPQQSPLSPEEARDRYGLNDSPSSTKPLITKQALKTVATTGTAAAAAAYQSLSPEQKRKAQEAAVKGATNAALKWQSLKPETKASLKKDAASATGKAFRFLQTLPN